MFRKCLIEDAKLGLLAISEGTVRRSLFATLFKIAR